MKTKFKVTGIVIVVIISLILFGFGRFMIINDGKYSHVKFITDTKIILGITDWQINHDELTKDNINILEDYKKNYNYNLFTHTVNDNKTIKATEKIIQLNYDFQNKTINKEQFVNEKNKLLQNIPDNIGYEIATWNIIK